MSSNITQTMTVIFIIDSFQVVLRECYHISLSCAICKFYRILSKTTDGVDYFTKC